MSNILILDMHNICYRAQYGLPPLFKEPFGNITAIFGGLLTLKKIAKNVNLNWDYVFACFDSAYSYRRQVYPKYKSNRHEVPINANVDEKQLEKQLFNKQMEYFYKILDSLGFTCLKENGFEADDLIAKIVLQNKEDYKLIVSNDEDLYQLLNHNVVLYKNSKSIYIRYSRDHFIKDYEIDPQEWRLVKAIAGCTSDTIKGVPSIGEKRALAYIKKMGSEKHCKLIKEYEDVVNRNYELVQIPYNGTELKTKIPNNLFKFNMEVFKKLCDIMDFKSFSLFEWESIWKTKTYL